MKIRSKRTLLLFMLVSVTLLLAACGGPEGTYKKAQDLLAKGKYSEAAESSKALAATRMPAR